MANCAAGMPLPRILYSPIDTILTTLARARARARVKLMGLDFDGEEWTFFMGNGGMLAKERLGIVSTAYYELWKMFG